MSEPTFQLRAPDRTQEQREQFMDSCMLLRAAALELVEWADGRRKMSREQAQMVAELIDAQIFNVLRGVSNIVPRKQPHQKTPDYMVKQRRSELL